MDLSVAPSLAAALILLWLNYYVLSHRPVAVMWPALPMTFAPPLLFAIGDLLTFAFTDPEFAWVPVAVLYSGIIFVPSTWWLLALRFAEAQGQPLAWGRSRWVYAPLALAALLWIGMISNPWHGQFLTQVIGDRNQYHWIWWVHAVSGYTLVTLTISLYIYLAIKVDSPNKRVQILIMLAAAAVNSIANALYAFFDDLVPIDPTAIAFSVSGILFIVGIHGAGLFSLSSITLATIIRGQPTGIAVTDKEGNLLFSNPALETVLGVASESLTPDVYSWLGERLELEDESIDGATLKHLLRVEPTAVVQARLGEHRWLKLREAPVAYDIGKATGHYLQIEDVSRQIRDETEKEELQVHVAEMQRLESLGVLAGGIAHDFNNLLMAVSGNAELAKQLNSESRIDPLLQSVIDASARGARLTQQLLAYAGRVPKTVRVLELSALVQDTSQLLNAAVLPRGLELHFDLEQPVWVEGDQAQLEQLVMNLTINAADACRSGGGRVELTTGVTDMNEETLASFYHQGSVQPGRYGYLDVRDNGMGMSQETLSHIFDPFYSTKKTGHGLGLSAALGIVSTHQGALLVDTAPGEGARFRILLPLSGPAEEMAIATAGPARPAASTILVVDDEDAVRETTSALLKASGVRVIQAEGGAIALELLKERGAEIGAVVLDIAMPQMDGRETFRALRKMMPQLPVVFVSGHPGDIQTETDDYCQYLMKPFTQAKLIEKIREAERHLP